MKASAQDMDGRIESNRAKQARTMLSVNINDDCKPIV